VLLTPEERVRFLGMLRSSEEFGKAGSARLRKKISRELLEMCKRKRRCPFCGDFNGSVKKPAGQFRLYHEFKHTDTKQHVEAYLAEFENATLWNSQLEEHVSKAQNDLSPLTALELFRKITDADCELLNLNIKTGRPEHMIVTSLSVPPVCLRPSVPMGASGTNEDDLTIKLGDIIHINNYIRDAITRGSLTSVIMENWEFLQTQVAMYVHSDLPGFPKAVGSLKPMRALTQRL
jgi:DNA-directed RNA polymerase III subunit RPC1